MKCTKCPAKRGARTFEDGEVLCVNCNAARSRGASNVAMESDAVDTVSLTDVMRKLASMGSDLSDVKGGQAQVMGSISFLSAKFDEMSKRLDELQEANNAIKKENGELKSRVSQLELEVNKLEAYGRRQNIEIAGIPETEKEDVNGLVLEVLRHVDANITANDVDVAHRLGRPDNDVPQQQRRPRPLIVRFATRKVRDRIYGQRKELRQMKVRDLGHGLRGEGNIFINENLLSSTKQLLHKANTLRKEKEFSFLWTSNGRILVKKTPESPAIAINSEADLGKIK